MALLISRRMLLKSAAAGVAAAPFMAVARFAEAQSPLAVGGFDVVAYFDLPKDADAARGTNAHEAEYDGARYRFASAANKAAFEADPEKYAPKYGSHCAWAASKGYLAPGDPQAWTVWEGRLYLNFNKSVRSRWRGDIPGNVVKADKNWPSLKSQA
ncbi:MAG: YHS domain-containing (seleno)protein [Pseudomonadota bacterium]